MVWVELTWPGLLCCSERIKANLSPRRARRGKCSQMSRPGTLVRIGLKSPRYSLGASGLRSKVSMWLAPPQSQRTITDFGLVRGVFASASRRSKLARLKPPRTDAPARRNERRLKVPGQREAGDCMKKLQTGGN